MSIIIETGRNFMDNFLYETRNFAKCQNNKSNCGYLFYDNCGGNTALLEDALLYGLCVQAA
jgi:hypothetical protein